MTPDSASLFALTCPYLGPSIHFTSAIFVIASLSSFVRRIYSLVNKWSPQLRAGRTQSFWANSLFSETWLSVPITIGDGRCPYSRRKCWETEALSKPVFECFDCSVPWHCDVAFLLPSVEARIPTSRSHLLDNVIRSGPKEKTKGQTDRLIRERRSGRPGSAVKIWHYAISNSTAAYISERTLPELLAGLKGDTQIHRWRRRKKIWINQKSLGGLQVTVSIAYNRADKAFKPAMAHTLTEN